MTKSKMKRIPFIQPVLVRPRLMTSVIVALLSGYLLPSGWHLVTRLLCSWDLGASLYLILTFVMMYRSDDVRLRRRAAAQDEGALIMLGLATLGIMASLAAIFAELVAAKSQSGNIELKPIALAAVTVVLSWLCMQTIFAIHYAHEYYNKREADGKDGLEFPGKFTTPDYWDFIYFSYVIGTAAATADINITSGVIRRLVTVHCVLVFFFNTSILALAINVGASLV